MFEVEQEFKITVNCKIDEYDTKDALKEFDDLINPILEEIKEKLSDRFSFSFEDSFPEVTDLDQIKKDRFEDYLYDDMNE